MDKVLNVAEAKTNLSHMLSEVERGASFTIARAGKPIARLSAIAAAPRRPLGKYAGPTISLAQAVEPLSESELSLWE